jgi:hypothetical protein
VLASAACLMRSPECHVIHKDTAATPSAMRPVLIQMRVLKRNLGLKSRAQRRTALSRG